MASADPRVQRVVEFFESLERGDLQRIDTIYVADATFKDPFNDVRGVPAIEAIFEHMFDALREPRFIVRDAITEGDQCLLTWDFTFRFRRFIDAPQLVRGATHLRFDPAGRVAMHRDYWDAAEELYEKLPLIGVLMRWLKRRARR
jgi:ketosteroid isomerase-like protein